MRITELRLADFVVIPRARRTGDGSFADVREQNFAAPEWRIDLVSEGVFSLQNDVMPQSAIVSCKTYCYYKALPKRSTP